ncbi:WD repeat-containing protein 64-like [Watersipora subatra]|uniref:WD repeat-containing protein 64-like n=1 Tax=Watersipora subatra TaxID=2589382 RepID=UPI00355B1D4A
MKNITLAEIEASPEERRQIMADTLKFDQFCTMLTDLFGRGNIHERDMKALFRKISNNPDACIDWCELFGYKDSGMAADEDTLTSSRAEAEVFATNFRTRAGAISMEKRRLDSTRSINYCKQLDTYIATSKKGIVTQWDMKLKNIYCTDLPVTSWLIDCTYLVNLKKFVCCTERWLVIWDPKSQPKNMEFYTIGSFQNAFTSMAIVPTADPLNEMILLGDDKGFILTVCLSAADLVSKHATNIKKSPDGSRTTFILSQKNLATPVRRRQVHKGWALMLKWVEELQNFISCSPTDIQSLVIDELNTLHSARKLRAAAVFRGVNAFAYSTQANIVASAGTDKIVRLWHPSILAKPTGRLIGHLFTVVAIQFNEKDQHIISLSSARVFRVWCITSMTCLQIFTDNDDRAGERRIQVMLFDQRYQRLLTGSGVIDAWSLSRNVMNSLVVPQTHVRSIVQLLYNGVLKQFISLCTEPIIKVWDEESRNILYQLLPNDGSGEVTCMSISLCGYRLATGATDGSINVWDLGAGQEVKHSEERVLYKDEESVPAQGVLCLKFLTSGIEKQRLLIAAGWNNELRLYRDSDSESDLQLLSMFNDSFMKMSSLTRSSTLVSCLTTHEKLPPIGMTLTTGHKGHSEKILEREKITCTGLLPETDGFTYALLVGTQSGNIIVWNTESCSITDIFNLAAASHGRHSDILNSNDSKSVNMVGTINRKKATKSVRYLDLVGFTQLVISVHEDSGIRLWNREGMLVEEAVAMTRRTGVEVTCYTTNATDNRLVTGDALGYVTVWEMKDLVHGRSDSIQQVVSWKAHHARLTSVAVRPHKQNMIIYTSGTDGSVRIWYDSPCRYMGYLGQIIPIKLPKAADSLSLQEAGLPCDIKEKPLYSVSKMPKKRMHQTENMNIPLVFNPSSSSSNHQKTPSLTGVQSPFSGTKFFHSLAKPKQYNDHLEAVTKVTTLSNSTPSGFVFKTLPVYRVSTPGSISYPESSLRNVPNISPHSRRLPSITSKV